MPAIKTKQPDINQLNNLLAEKEIVIQRLTNQLHNTRSELRKEKAQAYLDRKAFGGKT